MARGAGCCVTCSDCAQALGAEIIVTFEGTSENGAQFMSRQSYLSSEIHWGYVFVDIVHHAKEGETRHTVDIARQVNKCQASKLTYQAPGASPQAVLLMQSAYAAARTQVTGPAMPSSSGRPEVTCQTCSHMSVRRQWCHEMIRQCCYSCQHCAVLCWQCCTQDPQATSLSAPPEHQADYACFGV